MTGIGATPRRSVVAEDIRNLQRWTASMVTRPLRRRARGRVFRASCLGFLRGCEQQVERALDARDHAGGNARVARRRLQSMASWP